MSSVLIGVFLCAGLIGGCLESLPDGRFSAWSHPYRMNCVTVFRRNCNLFACLSAVVCVQSACLSHRSLAIACFSHIGFRLVFLFRFWFYLAFFGLVCLLIFWKWIFFLVFLLFFVFLFSLAFFGRIE